MAAAAVPPAERAMIAAWRRREDLGSSGRSDLSDATFVGAGVLRPEAVGASDIAGDVATDVVEDVADDVVVDVADDVAVDVVDDAAVDVGVGTSPAATLEFMERATRSPTAAAAPRAAAPARSRRPRRFPMASRDRMRR